MGQGSEAPPMPRLHNTAVGMDDPCTTLKQEAGHDNGGNHGDMIREAAERFDREMEGWDMDAILASFADDCEIRLLGVRLQGKEGVRRWLAWLRRFIKEIRFEPLTIMVDGNTFVEEFIVRARFQDGGHAESRQAVVLVYEGEKIKSLRLYFDRLDFAGAVAIDFIRRSIVQKIVDDSLQGLT